MFDYTEFMNCSTLRRVWRAGNQQITETDEINLPKICTSLNQYLDGVEYQPCKDPLGKLSVLINGAAKLYQVEVNTLLRDCCQLDMEMTLRKTRMIKLNTASNGGSNVFTSETSLSASNQNDSEEHYNTKRSYESSSSKRKRQSTPNNFHNEKRSCLSAPIESSEEMDQTNDSHVPQSDNGSNEILTELNIPIERNTQRHEKGIQANLSGRNSPRGNRNSNSESFNEDLPFGFVMIYENYNDRLPNKIIYSSLNSSVKYL